MCPLFLLMISRSPSVELRFPSRLNLPLCGPFGSLVSDGGLNSGVHRYLDALDDMPCGSHLPVEPNKNVLLDD